MFETEVEAKQHLTSIFSQAVRVAANSTHLVDNDTVRAKVSRNIEHTFKSVSREEGHNVSIMHPMVIIADFGIAAATVALVLIDGKPTTIGLEANAGRF